MFGILAATYRAGSGTDTRFTYTISLLWKREKGWQENEQVSPEAASNSQVLRKKPVLWSWNFNQPTRKLSSILLLGDGLVLVLVLLQQGCTEQAHIKTYWAQNRSIFTTTAPRSTETPEKSHRRAVLPSRPLQIPLVLVSELPKGMDATDITAKTLLLTLFPMVQFVTSEAHHEISFQKLRWMQNFISCVVCNRYSNTKIHTLSEVGFIWIMRTFWNLL